MRTALDTNVISALWSDEPSAQGIENALFEARTQGGLVICAPVYCELLAHPSATASFVREFCEQTGITVEFHIEEKVWDRTGEAFARYAGRRRHSREGTPRRLLVDFIVAAHAELNADQLMTLDEDCYKTHFPKLMVITG